MEGEEEEEEEEEEEAPLEIGCRWRCCPSCTVTGRRRKRQWSRIDPAWVPSGSSLEPVRPEKRKENTSPSVQSILLQSGFNLGSIIRANIPWMRVPPFPPSPPSPLPPPPQRLSCFFPFHYDVHISLFRSNIGCGSSVDLSAGNAHLPARCAFISSFSPARKFHSIPSQSNRFQSTIIDRVASAMLSEIKLEWIDR